jgi:hypothetical protein
MRNFIIGVVLVSGGVFGELLLIHLGFPKLLAAGVVIICATIGFSLQIHALLKAQRSLNVKIKLFKELNKISFTETKNLPPEKI